MIFINLFRFLQNICREWEIYMGLNIEVAWLIRSRNIQILYVLFAENRDCMDESELQRKMNTKRLQLYMKNVYQTYDLQGKAGSNNAQT